MLELNRDNYSIFTLYYQHDFLPGLLIRWKIWMIFFSGQSWQFSWLLLPCTGDTSPARQDDQLVRCSSSHLPAASTALPACWLYPPFFPPWSTPFIQPGWPGLPCPSPTGSGGWVWASRGFDFQVSDSISTACSLCSVSIRICWSASLRASIHPF